MMLTGLITGLTGVAQILWRPLVVISGVASGLLLAGGAGGGRVPPRTGSGKRLAPVVFEPVPIPGGHLDLELELRAVLQSLEPEAAVEGCRLEIAVEPGLRVRADRDALRRAVGLATVNALHRAGAGRVLVAAGRHGGRLQVSIVDDGLPTDRPTTEAALRPAAEVCAMQGGTLEVHTTRGSGTKVAIRFPDPSQGRPAPHFTPSRVEQPAPSAESSGASRKRPADPLRAT